VPPGPFALAGHSMGGRVALEVLRQAPARVARLALLDTGYQGLDPGAAGVEERRGRERLLHLARTEGMRAMGRQWARGMVHPSRLDTPLFEAVLQMIERKTPDIFAAQIEALLGRPDATPLLATIRCPTLILCGRDDAWSPLSRHLEMQAAIAGAQLGVIEDSGHMTTMEQPDAVTQHFVRWLQDERLEAA
jgi:pimeloyl-ACP methyl ester carboxylesterase